jgi:16S rRNA (guanine1516-N2)-methyltransferase
MNICTRHSEFTSFVAQIAQQWGFIITECAHDEIFLEFTPSGLQLSTAGRPVCVDFAELSRRSRASWRKEAVIRAVRGHGKTPPSVIDTCAGLGRDAYLLASAGCTVTLLERAPVMAALLEDGLRRAATDPITQRLTLIKHDAIPWLQAQAPGVADVIYLDPMYPQRQKSALVKKEMRLLRQILGDDHDAAQLFTVALHRARHRVVVKRPRHAPPLERACHACIEGKSTRFDIFTCA